MTVTISADGAPLVVGSIDGERIAGIKVAATYGSGAALTYVTESGREVPLLRN